MELEERFRYIMKLNNLSASAFAEEIGVQRSSISHILSGRNKPSLEFIQKVLNRFPKVDAGWLINGTTSVKVDHATPNKVEGNQEAAIEGSNEKIDHKVEIQPDKGIGSKDSRKIKRILVFYDDQSFEEFSPND